MKHDPIATANALGVTTAVFYVFCRLFVGVFPGLMFTVAQSWFHGVRLTESGGWNLSGGAFVVGLLTSVFFAWLVGFLFAKSYNYFAKR